jgi:NADH-quinone oxidoreductase subunit N
MNIFFNNGLFIETSLVIFTLCFSLFGVVIRSFFPIFEQKWLTRLCNIMVIFLILCLFLFISDCNNGWLNSCSVAYDLFFINFYTQSMKSIVLFFFLFVFVNSVDFLKRNVLFSLEYFILKLLALLSMFFLLSANDLVVIYMALELQGLCFYILAAYDVNSVRSTEAGLKYFLVGSFASIIYLIGVSILYIITGTTNFDLLATLLYSNSTPILNLGIIAILVGIFFKLAVAPFHLWIADVYDGSPTSVTAFFAVLPKIVLLGILIRIISKFGISFLYVGGLSFFVWLSLISLFVGVLGALYQTSIKRLIAYSAVAHISFILLSLSTGSLFGIEMSVVYIIVYAVLGVGFFSIMLFLNNAINGEELKNLSDLSGLYRSAPVLGCFFLVNLFSLAGVPPLAGFYGKAFVLLSSIEVGYYYTSFIFVILSVLSSFYYLRLVKIVVYESREIWSFYYVNSKFASWIIVIAAWFNILYFVYFNEVLIFVHWVLRNEIF